MTWNNFLSAHIYFFLVCSHLYKTKLVEKRPRIKFICYRFANQISIVTLHYLSYFHENFWIENGENFVLFMKLQSLNYTDYILMRLCCVYYCWSLESFQVSAVRGLRIRLQITQIRSRPSRRTKSGFDLSKNRIRKLLIKIYFNFHLFLILNFKNCWKSIHNTYTVCTGSLVHI